MTDISTDTGSDLGPGVRDRDSRTFSSLKVRNYRLYFIGQGISLCGTWMQSVALGWLVLKLNDSGVALGLVVALQFLPVLLLAPYGGVLADRFSKRRMLVVTQSCLGVLALALGLLVATGLIQLWMVFVLAALIGTVNALDNPVRQTFVHEMVGAKELRNAVTLNSTEVNLSRAIGPAVAGALIVWVGLAPCFLINAVSFVAVLACLFMMRGRELHKTQPVKAAKGQIRAGFVYSWGSPIIRDVLIMMALVGTLSYEFGVSVPLLAKHTFHGDAVAYTMLITAMGVGAVAGGLLAAGRKRPAMASLTTASLLFGVAILAVAVSPTLLVAVAAMALVGAFSVSFTSLTNTILQLESAPKMRGRVMSLWTMGFLGSTLLGAPLIGWIAQRFDPRWGLAVGGIAALVAGAVGLAARRSRSRAAAGSPVVAGNESGA